MSYEEIEAAIANAVIDHGYFLLQVTGDPVWTYSIGLVDIGAPDLVCIGIDPATQFEVLHSLAKLALSEGEVADWMLDDMGLGLADVHAQHLDSDLFVSWRDWRGRPPEQGEIGQVLFGLPWLGQCHARTGIRLDGRPTNGPYCRQRVIRAGT